jgi:acetyl-CoA synthetase
LSEFEFTPPPRSNTWAAAQSSFTWRPPAQFNIADLICERWVRTDPSRVALIEPLPDGTARNWTFQDLSRASNQLAHTLQAWGVGRGDRVAVLLPQCAETLITHLAAYKLAAVLTPLFTLFGEDALSYRLSDSGAKALVTNAANLPKLDGFRHDLHALKLVLSTDGAGDGATSFWDQLALASDATICAPTTADDPALLSYTSGTTGAPKGALHGHRVLAAHVVGAAIAYDYPVAGKDVMWTPADWAWMGGSMNAMAPALYYGTPLIAHRSEKFDPEAALKLMADYGVSIAFLPPTALKIMRQVNNPAKFGAKLRAIGAAGEAMGAELLHWGKSAFGLTINEFYGQTECNMVVGNNARLFTPTPGAMGRAMPGHKVTVLRENGQPMPKGQAGELAIHRSDFGMFLGYWNKPEKTAEKITGDWMLTGDVAIEEDEGVYRFASRIDDVITSSGYRIGPTEIEDCLSGHPAVAVCAIVGAPDLIRTEIVIAFVNLRSTAVQSDELATELKDHVRTKLSPHLTPARIVFVDEIPMTATGKIKRRVLRSSL